MFRCILLQVVVLFPNKIYILDSKREIYVFESFLWVKLHYTNGRNGCLECEIKSVIVPFQYTGKTGIQRFYLETSWLISQHIRTDPTQQSFWNTKSTSDEHSRDFVRSYGPYHPFTLVLRRIYSPMASQMIMEIGEIVGCHQGTSFAVLMFVIVYISLCIYIYMILLTNTHI